MSLSLDSVRDEFPALREGAVVVGSVASDELVAPIANAQRELGREIDLVTYTPWDFSSRIVAGNRFLRTTLAGPRVGLIGGPDDA